MAYDEKFMKKALKLAQKARDIDEVPVGAVIVKDGKIIEVTYPEKTRIDAQGRIICKGNLSSEGSFLLNGNNYIAPGQSHIICTENVTLQINILSIDPIKAK